MKSNNLQVFELAPTPVEIYSFCQILVWRNSPNISVEDLLGTDVRLFNPALNKEVIRHVTGYEPFYILEEDDVCFMQGDSTAEVYYTIARSWTILCVECVSVCTIYTDYRDT